MKSVLLALLFCDILFPFSASAQKRITINEGEALVGLYTSDELPNIGDDAPIIGRDISLFDLSTEDDISDIDDIAYSFGICNLGSEPIESYTLRVTLDGVEIETINTPVVLTSYAQTISRTIPSDDLDYGAHIITVSVVDIDDIVPTENTDDDYAEKSFNFYASKFARQMHLIEQFTSIQCTYCPLGIELLKTLQDKNPDKYAWVGCHYKMSSGSDPFEIAKATYIKTFSGTNSFPRAAFDRCYLEDTETEGTEIRINSGNNMSINIGWYSYQLETVTTLIDNAVEAFYANKPAYVTVDIDSDYDASTRKLTVTVSGVGVRGAQSLLDGQRLTVYLTEDSLVYRQYYNQSWINDYVHDDVLRDVINEYPWGDDINWTSDRAYSNTITCTLDREWDADNMHIVAFISGPMLVHTSSGWVYGDPYEGYVHNTNMAKLGESSTISGIVDYDPNAEPDPEVEPEPDPEPDPDPNPDPDPDPTVDPDPETEPGPTVEPDPSESDGISTVGNDVTILSYYTADGYRVDAPVKGVNIVKLSDGSMRKIVVR